ncbi:hypothetical protein G6F46_002932 [Rhizopus delemar]|nr:hypothetical protein G6F43_000549 [Rhizopus delemar]KAG1549470.1 hypothetical protein G6F51_003033 [Rhizopus arrhizus]KAG1458814.1 hypothetical protein G6F55_005129 [Rhizopus delemar]KAG1516030.1 hypothetical protein G6F53_002466 [Rhizopus delemar]KAG1559668.1 hypothetical protein G6F49_003383 [Rhizopus delemar]
MLTYPLLIQFSFKYFQDTNHNSGSGLKRGVLIGATVNAIAGGMRWLGAMPSISGFAVLFLGQTMAAVAQVFIFSVPPQLAVAWFPEDEVNIATSIAISANSLGVGVGFALTPLVVKSSTSSIDIPNLLLIQSIICLAALVMIWIAFQKRPSYEKHTPSGMDTAEQSAKLLKQKDFIYILAAFGIVMGGQCAIATLLAQIIIPPLHVDETFIGLLGSAMLFAGSFASVLAGYYLDKTLKYRELSRSLSLIIALTLVGLLTSIEIGSLAGVVIACMGFDLASYAFFPAIIQFTGELFYPINKIIPTGYLISAGNISGVLLVALMSWGENTNNMFSMRLPLACLTIAMLASTFMMYQVKGALHRTAQKQSVIQCTTALS